MVKPMDDAELARWRKWAPSLDSRDTDNPPISRLIARFDAAEADRDLLRAALKPFAVTSLSIDQKTNIADQGVAFCHPGDLDNDIEVPWPLPDDFVVLYGARYWLCATAFFGLQMCHLRAAASAMGMEVQPPPASTR